MYPASSISPDAVSKQQHLRCSAPTPSIRPREALRAPHKTAREMTRVCWFARYGWTDPNSGKGDWLSGRPPAIQDPTCRCCANAWTCGPKSAYCREAQTRCFFLAVVSKLRTRVSCHNSRFRLLEFKWCCSLLISIQRCRSTVQLKQHAAQRASCDDYDTSHHRVHGVGERRLLLHHRPFTPFHPVYQPLAGSGLAAGKMQTTRKSLWCTDHAQTQNRF